MTRHVFEMLDIFRKNGQKHGQEQEKRRQGSNMGSMDEKIKNYFQHRQEVASVYLFGSRAAGTQRAASDVDIAVLLHHKHLASASALQENTWLNSAES